MSFGTRIFHGVSRWGRGSERSWAPARRLVNLQLSAARFTLAVGLACLLAAYCASVPQGAAQDWAPANRVVQGRVVDSNGTPLQNAIVYLKNEKTLEVKTYISTSGGAYRFGELSSDDDYQIWAQYQKSKSKTRSISSFDSRKQFTLELKLEPSK